LAVYQKPLETIERHFRKISDPCKDRIKEHELIEIIGIAIS